MTDEILPLTRYRASWRSIATTLNGDIRKAANEWNLNTEGGRLYKYVNLIWDDTRD